VIDLSPLASIQALVQYGAVAALVLVVVGYQRGKIISEQSHKEQIDALQKAKTESDQRWRERYEEVRNDRDRYRDIALMNAHLAVRGAALAGKVLEERVEHHV